MYFHGVKVYNASQPWRYAQGGRVHVKPNMTLDQLNNDSVHIIGQPGELIVPLRHQKFPQKGELVNKVVSYLKTLDVRLPNTH